MVTRSICQPISNINQLVSIWFLLFNPLSGLEIKMKHEPVFNQEQEIEIKVQFFDRNMYFHMGINSGTDEV